MTTDERRLATRPTRIGPADDGRNECYHRGLRFDRRCQECPRCGGAHIDRTDWLG
jgi:hypothetical protein